MHTRGVSVRYLGTVANMLEKVPRLSYLHRIAIGELITRTVKHLFTSYMQGVDMMSLSAAVSHFLNAYLSSCQQAHPPLPADELQPKNSKRKNKRRPRRPLTAPESNEWALLTPRGLWSQIKEELLHYFNWQLETDAVDATAAKYKLQKMSLYRSFCVATGVQMLLRDYHMDAKSRPCFSEEDVLNIFPVTKHINPRASDAYTFYTTGQTKIQQGYLKEGHELITEALNLLNSVYGAMHPEIAQCLRMLARLNYIMGDHQEALQYQQKAVLMSERVNGIDHPYTIAEYTHLALYCFANGQVTTSLKLLYRARYLMLLVCGEDHPEMALLDSNIGLILHAVGEYSLSLQFMEHALRLNRCYHGERSLKVAVAHHLVARTQSCLGDFRAALQNEKETFAIYKHQLGDEHEKTKESSECLRHLTQQAVVLQKKMNHIYSGKTGAALPPIQIQSPSMGSVLDMLNIINGILFVQISQQDIDNFKAEFEKRNASAATAQLKELPALKVAPPASKDEAADSGADSPGSLSEGSR